MKKRVQELMIKRTRNAIILAAGLGIRMIPINLQVPKALLEVNGEPLIERLIKQLHEVGIEDIYIIVGFMKEKFEYLIDKFNVTLIVNKYYSTKNNLYSMSLALNYLSDTYVLPCDIWCSKNPFHQYESNSWYMVSDLADDKSPVHVTSNMELVLVSKSHFLDGNNMVGICYLQEEQASIVRKKIYQMCKETCNDSKFWEEALYEENHMIIKAKVVHYTDMVEINTYEQLRSLDSKSSQLKSEAINIIAKMLSVKSKDIIDIKVLKKGMTNRSFLFTCRNRKYIMRVPGEGTDQLINRIQEAQVYHVIADKKICDDVFYINPENGYKITGFLEDAHCCNASNREEVKRCMKKLREFHELGLTVDHEFDIFDQINFYESLWSDKTSEYEDYQKTKENVWSLKSFINAHIEKKVLTHIDAVPDNFLFVKSESGKEEIRLIDWEYAGMQDPHVDIAMFCIYSFYDKKQIDWLIQEYFVEDCPSDTRIKIYCYISVCGLLWSNWCEYKRSLGVEFGEYAFRQYMYAKEYYMIVENELKMKE